MKQNLIRSSYISICSANASAVHRQLLCAGEVGDNLASRPPAVLHCAQLYSATLAPLVHGYFCGLHSVDRRLLLPHGVDGKEADEKTRPSLKPNEISGHECLRWL